MVFGHMDVAWSVVGDFRGGVLAASGVTDEIYIVNDMKAEEWNMISAPLESLGLILSIEL